MISQRVHRVVSSEAQRNEDCRGSGTIEHVVYQRLEVVKRWRKEPPSTRESQPTLGQAAVDFETELYPDRRLYYY